MNVCIPYKSENLSEITYWPYYENSVIDGDWTV